MPEGQEDGTEKKFNNSELTELFRARDASCPKGKKMEQRKSLTTRKLQRRMYYEMSILPRRNAAGLYP